MTEYTVALRNMVSGPAAQASKDAAALRSELGRLEGASTRAGRRSGGNSSAGGMDQRKIADDWQKMAAAAERAAARESAATERAGARATAAAQRNAASQAAAAERGAAQVARAKIREEAAAARAEQNFSAYRIRLSRREAAEKERTEKQILSAELKHIRERQLEENRAAAASRRQSSLAAPRTGSGGGFAGSLLGAVGMAGGYGALLAGVGYVAKEGFDTAQKIEQAKIRLTALLGSQEAAVAEIKDMVGAAAKTKFDWEDLVDATSSLSASFGDTNERRYVLASLADMTSVAGGGKQTLDQVVLAVNQVMGKGKLEAEELNQIIEPLKGVVSRRDFYTELASLMNVSAKDTDALMKKMAAKQKAGEISSRAAIQALTNVGRKKAGGGAAGSFAVQAGDTIEGQISNIKTGLATLFALSNVETWPAMVKLKVIMGDIANLFNADSKEGAKFMGFLKFYSNYLISSFITLGQVMTYPLRLIIQIGSAISEMVDAARFTGLTDWEAWADLGKNMALGIAQGVKAGAVWVYDELRNLASGAIETIRSKLDTHSPSRVMMKLGGHTSEGFALGIENGTTRVARAAGGLGDAAQMIGGSPSIGGRMGSGGTYNITVINQIQGSSDPVATGNAAAAATEFTLDRYFGRQLAQGA